MCDAIEYAYNGERIWATADARGSRLPVRQRGGTVLMVLWGMQGRSFSHERPDVRIRWPAEPWIPLEEVKRGAWADCEPRPVRLPVDRFMIQRRLDVAILDHWVTLRPGEYLQGALMRRGVEQAVYVVTVEPPAHLSVLSPWPRIVRAGTRPARP